MARTVEAVRAIVQDVLDTPYSIKFYLVEKNDESLDALLLNIGQEGSTYERIETEYASELRDSILEKELFEVKGINDVDSAGNALLEIGEISTIPRLKALDDATTTILNESSTNPASRLPSNIWGFLITIGNDVNTLVLFRKYYPIHLMKQGNIFIKFVNDAFSLVDNEALVRFDTRYQCIKLDGLWYTNDLEMFETVFQFDEVQKAQAQAAFSTLQTLNLFEGEEDLFTTCLLQKAMYRKILRIVESSQVLKKEISRETILDFSRNKSPFKEKFNYDDESGKIKINSQSAMKLFLKLMNDDYLYSELTKVTYDSSEKTVDTVSQE